MRSFLSIVTAFVLFTAFFSPALAEEKPAAPSNGDAAGAASVPESKVIAPPPAAIISVAGVWEGIVRGPGGLWKIHRMQLTQEGMKVTGEYDIDWVGSRGRGIRRDIQVIGTIGDSILKLTIPSSAYGSIEARVEGDRMRGPYISNNGTVNEMVLERKRQ